MIYARRAEFAVLFIDRITFRKWIGKQIAVHLNGNAEPEVSSEMETALSGTPVASSFDRDLLLPL
jgi:hypothetical protein